MRIARVIGDVTLSRSLQEYEGASLRVAVPLTLEELPRNGVQVESDDGEILVLWDEFGSGYGSLIALSESAEAARPFRPLKKPVDAYNAAILEHINVN
jgi:ethanolamine utilization protein EutN